MIILESLSFLLSKIICSKLLTSKLDGFVLELEYDLTEFICLLLFFSLYLYFEYELFLDLDFELIEEVLLVFLTLFIY